MPSELLQEAVQSFREIARAQGVELVVEDDALNRCESPIVKRFTRFLPT